MVFNRGKTVGIFSRESEETYQWLINDLLKFKGVKDVRPVYISSRLEDLRKHTEQCDFAIIYHSKNRGRVNVTDVTDSLYDKELEYLYTSLGLKNVLVVIDDLDNSDYATKCQIMEHQPSINKWAWDLILIDKQEKSDSDAMKAKLEEMEWIITRGNIAAPKKKPPKYQGDTIDSPKSSRRCCNKKNMFAMLLILIIVLLSIMIGYIRAIYEHMNLLNNHNNNASQAIKP
uniref:Uncharacterized protein n=1 Tax=Leptobrachium leishanense TaxID=445787 RepID=A0A8C5QGV8_9ANUR